MLRLIVSLLLVVLLVGCAVKKINCPEYPIPNNHVQILLDDLASKDKEVWAWGNKLLDLCQKLGTCEKDE